MKFLPLASLAAGAVVLSMTIAEAQDRFRPPVRHAASRHAVMMARIKAPPLTVKKRSFLDPGNGVEPGSDNEYISANTTEHVPIYNSFAPARFGESTLPGRFDLPDNPRFDPPADLDLLP